MQVSANPHAPPHPGSLPRGTGRRLAWLGVVLTLLAGLSSPIQAGWLSDVRIGEYDTHTRVVFEFSTLPDADTIETGGPDLLFVRLGDTQPDLRRKLSIEPASRIADVRLYRRQATLSAQLHLKYPPSRFDSFRLENPPRLVVDLFVAPPAEAPPPAPTDIAVQTEQREAPPDELPASEAVNDLTPIVAEPEPGPVSDTRFVTGDLARDALSTVPPTPQSAPIADVRSSNPSAPPTPPARVTARTAFLSDIYRPPLGSLQFYLWSGMIVLSILIAVCLVLLRISARRDVAADRDAVEQAAREDPSEPIIELTDRVESPVATCDAG